MASPSVRNLGIIAHVDAGKTTLSEQLLLLGGAIRSAGRVDEGLSTMDWMPQEQERGITIRAGVASFLWRGVKINFIDTPGHIDFSLDVERSLRVLDGAIAVFCGVRGVEPRSRAVWALAERFEVPRIAWVNKLDKPGADFAGTVLEIEEAFGLPAIPVDWPVVRGGEVVGAVDLVDWRARGISDGRSRILDDVPSDWLDEASPARDRLLEESCRDDEELMEQILANRPDPARVRRGLAALVRARKILPVTGGSALRGWNVSSLLDAAARMLPPPRPPVGLEDHPGAGLVFQGAKGSDGLPAAIVRMYAGSFRVGSSVVIAESRTLATIRSIQTVFADSLEQEGNADAGEIVAIQLDAPVRPGSTLHSPGHPVRLEADHEPLLVLELALEASDTSDQERIRLGLDALSAEDGATEWAIEPETGRILLRGQGELQLEIVVDRLREEFLAKFQAGKPLVRKRERLQGDTARVSDRVEWMGHVLEATVGLSRRPTGRAIEWGANLPTEGMKAAFEAGLTQAMDMGIQGGGRIEGFLLSVETWNPSTGAPPSLAKRLADHMGPILLEKAGTIVETPAVKVEILTPEDTMGGILQALQARGVQIQAVDTQRNGAIIRAFSPLEPMLGCATLFRSLSKGQATLSLEPGGWVAASA